MYKTAKEWRIYRELLREYKDDPYAIRMIESFKRDKSDKTTWERFQGAMHDQY